MRVALFGSASGVGGAQNAFCRLSQFLQRENHDLAVVAVGAGTALYAAANEQLCGTLVAQLPPRFEPIGKAFGIATATFRLRQFRPDIFVSVGLSQAACILAACLPGRTITAACDFDGERDLESSLFRRSESIFQTIIVQSTSMRDRMIATGFDPTRVVALPCFPAAEYPHLLKRSTSTGSSQVRLGYFGRLAANKGVADLVDAIGLIPGSIEFELDIWGTGPEEKSISNAIVTRGLSGSVQLKGPYPPGEAGARTMVGYDGVVVPSAYSEGIPLVLLEAMSLGIPAICTKVGAIPDCCEDNHDFVLCPPGTDGLIDGLLRFAGRQVADDFQPVRLRRYFGQRYGMSAVSLQWRNFLIGRTNC